MSLERVMERQRKRNPHKIIMKEILPGKLTYISLIVSLLGFLGNRFGFVLPQDEINGLATLIMANWDVIAQIGGLIGAFYGKLRANWRVAPKPEIIP
jgi:hypothetical protein